MGENGENVAEGSLHGKEGAEAADCTEAGRGVELRQDLGEPGDVIGCEDHGEVAPVDAYVDKGQVLGDEVNGRQ